ncbi:unnamed protein product [Symbiodinium natans]|uniref:Solute carrier family 40 protein n=1 Tax=Symbiodinium natans TaxID=878477 RepID=A0A812MHW3_9DINO|nr:unnamed protein product [Symbiodinium natans]
MRWLPCLLLLAVGSAHPEDSTCEVDDEAVFLQKSLVLVSEPVHLQGAGNTTQEQRTLVALVQAVAETTVPLPAWLCSGVLLVVFVILLQEVLVAPGLVRPALAPPSGALSQAIFVWMWVCTFAASSVVMPVAFDFAIAVGHGAVLSGFLLSAGALGSALGLLAGASCVCEDAWDQPAARRLCVWAGLLTSAIQLLEACVAQSALFPGGGLWLLLALRQGEAFSAGFALAPALAMQRRIAGETGSTMVQFSRSLGSAAGPVLLLLGVSSGLPSGLPQAFALAALVSLASAALCSLVLPQTLPVPAAAAPVKELEMDAGARKQLVSWISCFFMVRPFVTAGAEAATMLILEVGYGWSAVTSGLSISLASLASLLFAPLGADSPTRESMVFMTCAALSLLGCALVFDLKALGVGGLLVGDILLQSTAVPASAIAERWAKRAAAPNSTWSPSSFHLAALGSSSLSRFLAPPLVRALLVQGGRNPYGLLQLVLLTAAGYIAVRSCSLFWGMKAASPKREPKMPAQ